MENNRPSRLIQVFSMNFLLLISVLLIEGCAGSTPLQFYMLNAENDRLADLPGAPIDNNLVLGLGPIRTPDYLDRPQLVIAVSENQYRLDEHHRWAERLDQNISRALAQQLAKQTGVKDVVRFPWSQKQGIDYQVIVDVLEFHQAANEHSRLKAQWQIKHQDQALLSSRFDCSIAAKDDPEQIVKAQSQCLGRLGADIVKGLYHLTNSDAKALR